MPDAADVLGTSEGEGRGEQRMNGCAVYVDGEAHIASQERDDDDDDCCGSATARRRTFRR